MIPTLKRAVCAVLILGLAACGGDKPAAGGGQDSGQNTAKAPQLTIGHVGHDHQIALGVAALKPEATKEACGIWLEEQKPKAVYDLYQGEKQLARFIVKKVGGGSNMPAAMQKGDLDIGFGGIPAVIKFIDKGVETKILCPLNVDGDMLLVHPEFPARTWPEFVAHAKKTEKPIKIGVKNIYSVAKLVFEKACIEAGIGDRIDYVNLKSNKKIVPTLKAKGIDGAATNEPVCSKAIHKKVGVKVALLADLPPAGRFKAHPCCCICATGTAIADHPDVLKAFVKLMKVCTDMINQDKKAAADLGARWTSMDPAVEHMSIPNIVYKIGPDPEYRKGLAEWYKGMLATGFYKQALKEMAFEAFYKKVHDFSFIEAAMKG